MAYQFALALLKHGHEVAIAHGPIPFERSDQSIDEVSFLGELERAGARTFSVTALQRSLNLKAVVRLLALIAQCKTTHLVGFHQRDRANAILAARLFGCKVAVAAGNRHVFYGRPLVQKLKRHVYGAFLRSGAHLVLCTSEVVRADVLGFGVPSSKARLFPNAIDVSGFPTHDSAEVLRIRQALGVLPKERLLVNVGRIDPQKGLDVLLEAFAKVIEVRPALKLALVGGVYPEGHAKMRGEAYRKDLEDLTGRLGLEDKVLFLGTRRDVPLILQAANLYVHSALWEGLPLAVLEALAAGLPVIMTDCSGRLPGFDDGHGFMVAKGSSTELSSRMLELLERSDAELAAMGARGRALALGSYDIAAVGRQFVTALEEIPV
jgi:glycosyltransferase involved in cell wall biosynthesis